VQDWSVVPSRHHRYVLLNSPYASRFAHLFDKTGCNIDLNPPGVLKWTEDPTAAPTRPPTRAPSKAPSRVPTTAVPSMVPSLLPTCTRTNLPTTATPSLAPSTAAPSPTPSNMPTCYRSKSPTRAPNNETPAPTCRRSKAPSSPADCTLSRIGESCYKKSQCCSDKCTGPSGAKTCRE
jgi:hypothetical protein